MVAPLAQGGASRGDWERGLRFVGGFYWEPSFWFAKRAKNKKNGKKNRGKPSKSPDPGPRPKDQVNLTDEESRIMPTSGGGFMQAYTAQASVDIATMLIVTAHMTQKPNDSQQIEPALAELANLPGELGHGRRYRLLQRRQRQCLPGGVCRTAHCRVS